jgi:hypothetical protein
MSSDSPTIRDLLVEILSRLQRIEEQLLISQPRREGLGGGRPNATDIRPVTNAWSEDSQPQQLGGSEQSRTVATFERPESLGPGSPSQRVMPKEKPDKSS